MVLLCANCADAVSLQRRFARSNGPHVFQRKRGFHELVSKLFTQPLKRNIMSQGSFYLQAKQKKNEKRIETKRRAKK